MTDDFMQTVWAPSTAAAFRRIGDEVVIVDTSHNQMMTLNDSGTELWSMLGDGVTAGALCEGLTKLFDVEFSQAQKDVADFLSDMEKRGLVVKQQTPKSGD